MPHSFDPVFGDWYTEKQLGSGTDGKAYTITRTLQDGTTERAVLKTIRVGDYRNEKKSFNKLGDNLQPAGEDTLREKIIANITENIDIIRKTDNGKHFVRYEAWEKRKTSDGKGTLILIRLEEMRSLTDVLDNFSLTRDETLRLGISICRALVRCRDFGYIYPNLKPENILFVNRVPVLGDIGLAAPSGDASMVGTPSFLPPEVLSGARAPDAASDLYALGRVAYTALTGFPPGRYPRIPGDLPKAAAPILAFCRAANAEDATIESCRAALNALPRSTPRYRLVLPLVILAAAIALTLFAVRRGRETPRGRPPAGPIRQPQISPQPPAVSEPTPKSEIPVPRTDAEVDAVLKNTEAELARKMRQLDADVAASRARMRRRQSEKSPK